MYVVIPARYTSTRLPGKPLADLCGKTLIQHVYECAQKSLANRVIIATDDERISEVAEGFGAEVCMTAAGHRCGTDRIAEVVEKLGLAPEEIVVNLQGDEPLMPASLIDQVADTLVSHDQAEMATACHTFNDQEMFADSHVVKVVLDERGYALYFSRAAIPWHRDLAAKAETGPVQGFRHIGLYAYRAGFIQRYATWPPCPLEQAESLEQLRALWHGERIAVCEARELPGPGVDTEADLERVRIILQR